MTYSIEKVTTLIGARRYGDQAANIGFLLTDSRSLCFPEETLFFALKSGRRNGHEFIPDLYRRGVRNFVVDALPQDYATTYPGSNFLKVISPLEALQRLAERHRDEFNIPVVGVTGSKARPSSRSGSISCSLRRSASRAVLVATIPRLAFRSPSGCSASSHRWEYSRQASASPARCRRCATSYSPPSV